MTLINQKWHIVLAVALATSIFLPQASANPNKRGGERGGPPPEAIEACANQTEGSSCSFAGRSDQQMQGVCMSPPQGEGALACAPEGGPRGRTSN